MLNVIKENDSKKEFALNKIALQNRFLRIIRENQLIKDIFENT
jgi:hypothetical protein